MLKKPFVFIGFLPPGRARMTPKGVNFGQFWIILSHFGEFCTTLINFVQVWSILSNFGQFWTLKRTPWGAWGDPRGAKGTQESAKRGPRGVQKRSGRPKMGKAKMLKNHLFLLVFWLLGVPGWHQKETILVNFDSFCLILVNFVQFWSILINFVQAWSILFNFGPVRWSCFTGTRQRPNRVRGSFLSNCPEIRSPWLCPSRPNLQFRARVHI